MYEFRRSRASVREPSAPYGWWTADGDTRYPADDVLDDLPAGDAAPERIARILARFAALRHWILRVHGGDAAVTAHAEDAARIHLAAVPPPPAETAWAEGALLGRLLTAGPWDAPALLALAGAEARGAGDAAGAAALRKAARLAALLRLRGRGRPPQG